MLYELMTFLEQFIVVEAVGSIRECFARDIYSLLGLLDEGIKWPTWYSDVLDDLLSEIQISEFDTVPNDRDALISALDQCACMPYQSTGPYHAEVFADKILSYYRKHPFVPFGESPFGPFGVGLIP